MTGPATEEVTVALAMPFVVVLRLSSDCQSVVKFAFSAVVTNSPAVPFRYGALFCVTVAVSVDVEAVNGVVVVGSEVRLAPVGGGVVPPVPPLVR